MQLAKVTAHKTFSGGYWDCIITPGVPKFYMKCFGIGHLVAFSLQNVQVFNSGKFLALVFGNVLPFLFTFFFFFFLSETPSWLLDILDWYSSFLNSSFFLMLPSIHFFVLFSGVCSNYLLSLLLNFKISVIYLPWLLFSVYAFKKITFCFSFMCLSFLISLLGTNNRVLKFSLSFLCSFSFYSMLLVVVSEAFSTIWWPWSIYSCLKERQ